MWELRPLTRGQAHTPCAESGVLNAGPPGKSQLGDLVVNILKCLQSLDSQKFTAGKFPQKVKPGLALPARSVQTWTRSLDLLPHSQPLLVAHTNLSQVLFLQPPLTGLCSLDTLFRIRVHYFLVFLFPMLSPPPKLLSLQLRSVN